MRIPYPILRKSLSVFIDSKGSNFFIFTSNDRVHVISSHEPKAHR